eukprot:7679411-Pyramimonas_sp.AAC.1
MAIANCHIPNTNQGLPIYERALRSLTAQLPSGVQSLNIVLGDLNFALWGEGRMTEDGQHWSEGDRPRHDLFNRFCERWLEYIQYEPTLLGWNAEATARHASRLDRVYSDTPSAILADITVATTVHGSLDRCPSDHRPIVFSIAKFDPRRSRCAPVWLCRTPEYKEAA